MRYGPFPKEHWYVPKTCYAISCYRNPMKILGYSKKVACLVYLNGVFFIPSETVVYLLNWTLQFPAAAYPTLCPISLWESKPKFLVALYCSAAIFHANTQDITERREETFLTLYSMLSHILFILFSYEPCDILYSSLFCGWEHWGS